MSLGLTCGHTSFNVSCISKQELLNKKENVVCDFLRADRQSCGVYNFVILLYILYYCDTVYIVLY